MWDVVGFISVADLRRPWFVSHAQLPTPLVLPDGRVRVFFAGRNDSQYSSVGFVDMHFDGNGAPRIIGVSESPVLVPGDVGTFDEHGIFPSCVVHHDDTYFLYYVAWNKGAEPPLFYATIGLATSSDGTTFAKRSNVPLLGRGEFDPCLVTSPNVFVEGDRWLMTYVSGFKWDRGEDYRLRSYYDIKVALGDDPFNWQRTGHVALPLREGERNIARSAVVRKSSSRLSMWFSYVNETVGRYRIGYAESSDGMNWERDDASAGFSTPPTFAAEMMCYPAVFRVGTKLFMAFNGNRYGEGGFGLAVWNRPWFGAGVE